MLGLEGDVICPVPSILSLDLPEFEQLATTQRTRWSGQVTSTLSSSPSSFNPERASSALAWEALDSM